MSKQVVARAYRPPLPWLLPLYNVWAKLAHRWSCQGAGAALDLTFLAFLTPGTEDPDTVIPLVQDALALCPSRTLSFGLHASHQALPALLKAFRPLDLPDHHLPVCFEPPSGTVARCSPRLPSCEDRTSDRTWATIARRMPCHHWQWVSLPPRSSGHQVHFYDDKAEAIPDELDVDLLALSVETFYGPPRLPTRRPFPPTGHQGGDGRLSPDILPKEALQHADAVVTGDAEGTWEQLLADAERDRMQSVYQGNNRNSLKDMPDRSLDLRGQAVCTDRAHTNSAAAAASSATSVRFTSSTERQYELARRKHCGTNS